MINLTENDKEIIRHLGYPKIVNLSSGSYLIKADYDKTGVNELIGKKLADIMGLVCPRYFLVEVDNDKYLLSEDLNQYGEFISALEICENFKSHKKEDKSNEDITISDNSIYSIWNYLEDSFPLEKSKELMNEIIRMYIFDILFLNSDRDLKNWGILTQTNGNVNIVIFDNELIFYENTSFPGISLTASLTELYPSVYDDFRIFLKESSSEFTSLFKYYFDLITPEFFKGLIEQIERRDNIQIETKEELVEKYKKHRTVLMQIYEEEIKKGDNHAR